MCTIASSLDRIQYRHLGPTNTWVLRLLHPSQANKKVEFDTPNRTYCSNPLCSAFKRPESIINEQDTCPGCNTITCTLCKATAHEGAFPIDTALHQLLHTANENSWQRCYSCRRLVELDVGCNHITFVSSLYPLNSQMLLSYLVATVECNSATSVHNAGRHVLVHNGTKSAC